MTPAPDPRLRFDETFAGLEEIPRSFLRGDTARAARGLIGAWIACRHGGHWYGARIVETEAYLGRDDPAAHSCRGRRTPRVEPMYRDGGHLYVYLVYGMHHCANVVTRTEGLAEAVLLRAAEAPAGAPEKLLSGPGRLCRGLGITTAASGMDLLAGGKVRLARGPDRPRTIRATPRIGVAYAGEAAGWPLRFFDAHSRAVSGPARLNRG